MRGLVLASAVFLLSIVPVQVFAQQTAGTPSLALEVRYTQFTLANGLHVILHEDHTIPMVTVNVWYHVGSAREKPGRTGLAHLFEHLMFEGSGHVQDVSEFFKRFYQPGNASLVVAGDIDPVRARAAVEKWFADVKPGTALVPPIDYPRAFLAEVEKKTIQDRVQLPRLYIDWLTPAAFTPGDAELDVVAQILAGGKNSRLYKRLVYDLQIAQDVSATQGSAQLGSEFEIVVTPRPLPAGATIASAIDRIRGIIDEEIARLQQSAPDRREMERALNQIEASFYDRMEQVAGIGDQLNAYYAATGNPDYFNEDLSRYRALSASDVSAAAAKWLPLNRRVELVVEPK